MRKYITQIRLLKEAVIEAKSKKEAIKKLKETISEDNFKFSAMDYEEYLDIFFDSSEEQKR